MTLNRVSLVSALFRRQGSGRHPVSAFALAVAAALIIVQICSSVAAAQKRGLETMPEPGKAGTSNGKYYALIIGINHYPSGMAQLKTAVNDAYAVGKLLEERYGFQVQYLVDRDATRFNILKALTKLRSTLNENDNLLIYYGGHGYFDKAADKAYWLPVDAESATSPNVIMADDLNSNIRALPSRHVLIVSDSCYSGDLSRDAGEPPPPVIPTEKYLRKELQAKSRTIMASGGDEPVSDSGANGHSVFANAVLKALQKEEAPVFSAEELFYASVRKQVAGNADQIPKYTHVRNSGDDDGDFIFARKGAQISDASSSDTTSALTRSAVSALSTGPAPEPPSEPAADIPKSNRTSVPGNSVSASDAFDRGLADLKNGQFQEAFQLLTLACNGGVSRGCGNLGAMYQKGNGVNQDLVQAAALYRKGCGGDAWGACFLLGVMYETGSGVATDKAQALTLYRRACDGGDGRGCVNVAIALAANRDFSQADTLFFKACDTNVPRGCSLLGLAYHQGDGVPKDESKAALLTKKGCDGGDPMGCNLLGVGYEFGYGVPKNKQQAVALYRQSCSGGFDAGCKNLNRFQR